MMKPKIPIPNLRELPAPASGKTGWPWLPAKPSIPEFESPFAWPKISIITPSFNQGQFIEEAMRSVLLQGYPNLEYIIIDGGSTDNTVEIIKEYEPWLAYWVSESDRGQSHALNKGFEYAGGQIVAWLNADDLYLPAALFFVAKTVKETGADWVVGITSLVNSAMEEIDRFIPQVNTGEWRRKNYKSMGWLDFVLTHQSGTALPQPSSFWSKDAIIWAGGIDESLKYVMDHYLCGRLAHIGYRPALIAESLACFRVHERQKSTQFPFIFWQEELNLARKWRLEDLTFEEKRILAEYGRWFSRFIIVTRLKRMIGLEKSLNLISKVFQKVKFWLNSLQIRSVPKGVISKSTIARYLPSRPVIVEAGAHIGRDTVELARYFPAGKIHAFEPIPALFLQLSEQTRAYKNIQCYRRALGEQSEETIMYVSSGASDGSSSILRPKNHLIDHPDVIFKETIKVQCTTLDQWAETFGIEKVDLLWLDMQGNEINALKSGLKVLEKVSAIYTEVNLKEVYEGAPLYEEIKEWLKARNFEVEIEELPWHDGGNVLFIRQ